MRTKKNLTENKADLFYGFPILRLKIPSISFSFFKVYSIALDFGEKKNRKCLFRLSL